MIDDYSAAWLNDFWSKTVCTMDIEIGENDRERHSQKRKVINKIIIIMYTHIFSRYHVIIILLYYHNSYKSK